MGFLVLLYGIGCYLAFLACFAYLVAFVGDLGVPRSLSVGPASPPGQALGVDLVLLGLFAAQHSLMARARCKRLLGPAVERSTYVLASSLALALLFRCWRPLPGTVWSIQQPAPRLGVWLLFGAGVALTLASTCLISHADLFGLRQVWFRFRARPYREPEFRLNAFYARIRHPLMLGFLVTFWAGPTMTVGHLLFAAGATGYILAGTWLEERDLLRSLGPEYQAYRRSVPRFCPLPLPRKPRPKDSP
jgi:protein-S-isoprenylcysteine O-methyltransferase Ste14